MQEARQERISRLKGRKAELLGRMRELRASTVRNAGHKVEMLKAQGERVNAKIKELRG